jgi:hypothetical protein
MSRSGSLATGAAYGYAQERGGCISAKNGADKPKREIDGARRKRCGDLRILVEPKTEGAEMRLIPLIGAAILLCLHLSPAFPATDQATRFKIENSGIILVQNSGCDECKSRWQQCRTSCKRT